jgi:histone acetyltransferase (RNA polymerase elongator complex component)
MTDIEDIIKPFWFDKEVSESNIEKCYLFLDKYCFEDKNLDNIKEEFVEYQSRNQFGGILKYGTLIVIYKQGRISGRYPESKSNLEPLLKVRNVRENSGVLVFSVFTSAYPTHTIVDIDGNKKIVNETGLEVTDESNIGQFSCKYKCSFCPEDPKMPKSYIASEPGVARAILNDFDAVRQVYDRSKQYLSQGHIIDKAEVIILGGTFDSYSLEYRIEFVRDLYWIFNVLMDLIFYDKIKADKLIDYFEFEGKKLRQKLSLEEEIIINETAQCRVIGLTPETRPDQVNNSTIKFMRRIGAAKVQLGVQHLDDNILRYNKRGCYRKDTIRAIKMLKDNGFKVACHLMLDMPCPPEYDPASMPQRDADMLHEFNTNPDFKVDELKIYPCVVTEHTLIKKWQDEGKHTSYGNKEIIEKEIWRKMSKREKFDFRMNNPLYKNIFLFYSQIHPSVRVDRIIRDIPNSEIFGGTTQTGMRSEIDCDLEQAGLKSGDIRFREVGSYRFKKIKNIPEPIIKEIIFDSSGGVEHFIPFETDDENSILHSFLRLRLSPDAGKGPHGRVIFPELVDCALVREVKTYGQVKSHVSSTNKSINDNVIFNETKNSGTQHKGFGTKLLLEAEKIALDNGYTRIAVISGIGVREFYRKRGYNIDSKEGCYQIKLLEKTKYNYINIIKYVVLILSILIGIYYSYKT